MRNKIVLKIKRFQQKEYECAVASCSSFANYYDPDIQYKNIRKNIDESVSQNGMNASQQGILLNELGLKSIAIVTADTDYFDFSWQKRKQKWKINRLKKLKRYYMRSGDHSYHDVQLVKSYIKFLEAKDCDNDLIVDWDFPKWIKASLRKNHPVIASINYTSYFKMPKEKDDTFDDIKGEATDHSFVIRGFDKTNIYVVDSAGRRTKGYSGCYKIKWEHFLVNIGTGDLIFSK